MTIVLRDGATKGVTVTAQQYLTATPSTEVLATATTVVDSNGHWQMDLTPNVANLNGGMTTFWSVSEPTTTGTPTVSNVTVPATVTPQVVGQLSQVSAGNAPAPSTVFSRQQRVALWAVPLTVVGDTWVQSTSGGSQQYPYGQSNTGAQNAAITWPFVSAAGIFEIDLFHLAGANRGIYTIQIDGITVGTLDGYAAAGAQLVSALTGVSIPSTGAHTITLLMATKNGSSSSYFAVASEIILTKTA